MALGSPGRPSEPLGVIIMALALVFAAVLGAAAGLLWHASGLGEDEAETADEGAPS
jgi:hypothetical protein